MNADEFYDILYQMADTVIEIKEIDPEQAYRNDVFEVSKKQTELFLEQVKKQLSECKEENEIVFVKETTLNFLLFALRKLIVDFDCPDENIEYIAEHIKDKIIECTRCEFEKKRLKNE